MGGSSSTAKYDLPSEDHYGGLILYLIYIFAYLMCILCVILNRLERG